VVAATAARLGLECVLVLNGFAPDTPRANTLLDRLLGADVRYVATREARRPAMEEAAAAARAAGKRPYVIPVGASTALGASAYARAVLELAGQTDAPDVIVHATSSGGTQAGLIAGCALAGWPTRVVGVSADDPAAAIAAEVRRILDGLEDLLRVERGALGAAAPEVEDGFVGGGYGIPTDASADALALAARAEGLFLDPVYTAKALAALIAYVRAGAFRAEETVLFWHTGGQVALFA
jgi:1-aminocyclopropane-1-carboxylate deaminase/D-cysteine desulfhydrase-like pyridoxal-dependent ACC family enzyme